MQGERFPRPSALALGKPSPCTAEHPEPRIFSKTGYIKFSVACQVIPLGEDLNIPMVILNFSITTFSGYTGENLV